MTGRYRRFYKHWRKRSTVSKFQSTFPYELPLGVVLPFCPGSTSENKIIVTKSYDHMFHRVLRFRENDEGRTKGIVLTGQPGIGVSL